jgi:hypothetical protein
MENQDIEKDDVKDIATNIYRIVPEVRDVLLRALDYFQRLPVAMDKAIITRAFMDLSYPLQINAPQTSQQTMAPNLLQVKYDNLVTLFKRELSSEQTKATSPEIKKVLDRILLHMNDVL